MSLQGKSILVFGATGGIGRRLSERLLAAGARVVGSGRDPSKLAALEGLGVHPVTVEASDPSSFGRAVSKAQEGGHSLEGAVCCLGSILLKPAHLTADHDFLEVLQTNLHAAFWTLKHCAPALIQNGGGSLVFVSTAAARLGLANHDAIAAAKAGVQGLTLSAAATYAPRKIRVNAVAPGLVDGDLARRSLSEQGLKISEAMHPLKRLGSADDVASAIEWFLDPSQSWVTGQVLGVDGGLGSLRSPA